MTYIPQPIKTEGGRQKAVVSDENVETLLKYVLAELKKLNIQLGLLTDVELEEEIQNAAT